MPGLLVRAAKENSVDLSCSWVIGRVLDDIEAGKMAGCRCILVSGSTDENWGYLRPLRRPDFTASGIDQAAHIIWHGETGDGQQSGDVYAWN